MSLLTNTFGGFEEDFVDIDFVTAVALAPINDDDDEEDVVHEEEEEEEEKCTINTYRPLLFRKTKSVVVSKNEVLLESLTSGLSHRCDQETDAAIFTLSSFLISVQKFEDKREKIFSLFSLLDRLEKKIRFFSV